jgi:hypothetical protein
MTTKISSSQAIDAVATTRPDPELIDEIWTADRARQVFDRIDSATPVHRKTGRRWALIGVAAALIVALGLSAQALLPVGTPGSPTLVQALDRLAQAVPAEASIPQGSYELTVTKDTNLTETITNNGTTFATATSTRSTWMASDGWSWAHQSGDDPGYYIFSPIPWRDNLASAPADPKLMAAYLRLRVSGSTSVDEAMFVAVADQLRDNPMSAATRAAAIRMLADVGGITVTENTKDPAGRAATKVGFVDQKRRPGEIQSIYLDPTNCHLLAEVQVVDGKVRSSRVYVERRIVATLPDDIVTVLGTDRAEKSIRG